MRLGLEFLAVGSAITYVILAASEKRSCWWFYILSALFYMPVLVVEQLYLYAALQLLFLGSGVYGLVTWEQGDTQLIVHSMRWRSNVLILCAGLLLGVLTAYLLVQYVSIFDAMADSFISVFSIIATLLTARKVFESWYYWIVINLVATFVYGSKWMLLSALLALINTVVSFYGLHKWRQVDTRSS